MRTTNRTLIYALTLSALLHLCVAWIVRPTELPPVEPVPVTILFQEPGAPGTKDAKQRQTTKKKSLGSIPLSALVPKIPVRIQKQEDWTSEVESESPQQTLSWTDSQTYDGLGFSSAGHSAKHVRFISSLWRMIDQSIEENPFLSEYHRTGNVFLRFEIDEQGRLVPGSLKASAADRVLKVLAARATRKAIRNETGDVQFPDERTFIQARFSWADYRTCSSRRGHSGNLMSFCHYAENKRKTFTTDEKTATWAGAIYNHGPWAYEEIKKYQREESRRKSKFNPFEQYERDPDWNL